MVMYFLYVIVQIFFNVCFFFVWWILREYSGGVEKSGRFFQGNDKEFGFYFIPGMCVMR